MPYLHNRIGPTPIVDIGDSLDTRSDVVALGSMFGSLDVMLSTGNLGTASEAYHRGFWDGSGGSIATDAVGHPISIGVALQPLENIPIVTDDSNPAVFIDYSIHAIGRDDQYLGKDARIFPFVALLDGTSPSDGFSATTENQCAKWSHIPDRSGGFDETLSTFGHVLLKDIISGDIPTDQMIVIGFNLWMQGNGTMHDLSWCISARYAFDIIKTVDRIHS